MPVAAHRLRRRHRARAAAAAGRLGARPQPDRGVRPVGAAQRRVAADRALRPAHDRMAVDAGAVAFDGDRAAVQRSLFTGDDPVGDFGRREALHRAPEGGQGGARQDRRLVAGGGAQEVLDLAVGAQAVLQTGPARRVLFPRPEDRSEKRPQTVRPDQHPGDARGAVAPVRGGVLRVEIVGGGHDREGRLPGRDDVQPR